MAVPEMQSKMRTLDFFFQIGSTYSYLSVFRIEKLAVEAGLEVRWRPFSVLTLMLEQNNIPFRGKPVKMAYMWRDIERRAACHGLPFKPTPVYPVDREHLSNRVATYALEQGWGEQFVKATYLAWFIDGKLPGDPVAISEVLVGMGKDPAAILQKAETPGIRLQHAAHTDLARSLGIFGSPTFAFGNEIFWGDDRLEEAIAWALDHSGE